MTRLVTEELRGLAASVNPPPHLHQPEPGDLARYAELLTDRGIDLDRIRVEAALDVPRLLRAGAFDDPVPGRPPGEITRSTYRQDVARALPAGLARQILDEGETRWRMLQIVLRRAETAGHDIGTLLASPALRTGIGETGPVSVHFAHAITRLLADYPTPALTGMGARTRDGVAYAWTHLAWAFKAAENRDVDPATLLPGDETNSARARIPGIVAAWLHAQAHGVTRPQPQEPVLPWLPDPVPGTITDPDGTAYLDQLRGLVAQRVTTLRGELETAVLAGNTPTWAASITTAYTRYEHTRPRWLDHATVVAAFREQHPALVEDPDQPLGPHPEPAPHGDRAHARAHAAAAHALARAWEIAHPTGTRHQAAEMPDAGEAEVRRQVATAAWTALTPEQKTAVAATVLARAGSLPAPTHPTETVPVQSGPEPAVNTSAVTMTGQVSGLNEAVTHPAVAADLYRALVAHGHLADPDARPGPDVHGDARRRQARLPPTAPTRPARPARDPRSQPRRQVDPEPVAEQHRRYDPQPGRIEPQPGRQYRL